MSRARQEQLQGKVVVNTDGDRIEVVEVQAQVDY